MKNYKLRLVIVPLIYFIAITSFLTSIYFLQKSLTSNEQGFNDEPTNVVVDENGEDLDTLPVVTNEEVFMKPFSNNDVQRTIGFYDYQGDEESQLTAMVFKDNTYYQNLGNDYSAPERFEVMVALSGQVMAVDNDSNLGSYVEVMHENNVSTVYYSLSDVTVSVGDVLVQGDVVGYSGRNNVKTDLENQLYFQVYGPNGQPMDAEKLYDKKLSEIE